MAMKQIQLSQIVCRTAFCLMAMVLVMRAEPVFGQEYEVIPPPSGFETSSAQAQARSYVQQVLKGSKPLDDASMKAMDRYFLNFFARMTLPERIDQLANDREDLFKQYFAQAKSQEAHDHLVQYTLNAMKFLSSKNCHPAVRYNAMLILGDLNESEESKFTPKAAAKPLPVAFESLRAAFLLDAPPPKQIDAVRVAALLGILRHAEYDREAKSLTSDQRKYIIDDMIAVLGGSMPPGVGERSAEGQMWMKRRALDILGALGDVGAEGKAVTALAGVIADDKAPMSLRTTAASALGRIRFQRNYPLDVKGLAKMLAGVASRAAHSEVQRLRRQQARWLEAATNTSPSPIPASGGYDEGLDGDPGLDEGVEDFGDDLDGYSGGGYSGGVVGLDVDVATRERYKLDLVRRRFAYRLACVQEALTGTYGTAAPSPTQGIDKLDAVRTGDTQKYVNDVAERLRNLFKMLEKPAPPRNGDPPPPAEELQTMLDNLDAAVKDLDNTAGIVVAPPPVDAAAPASDLDGAPAGGPAGSPSATPDAAPASAPTASPPAAAPVGAGPPAG